MTMPSPTPAHDALRMTAGEWTAAAIIRPSPPEAIGGSASTRTQLTCTDGARRAHRKHEFSHTVKLMPIPEGRRHA